MHVKDHVEDYAKKSANNWKKFESFMLWEHPFPEGVEWALLYTHNRDSTILDQSNSAVIKKAMDEFLNKGDIVESESSHWAVGWVAGYAIRVYDDEGNITPAFTKFAEMQLAKDDYPVLDESDYSEREWEATHDNIENEGRQYLKDNPPEDWVYQLVQWWDAHDSGALESSEDQGAWPSEEQFKKAMEATGMLSPEFMDDEQDESPCEA